MSEKGLAVLLDLSRAVTLPRDPRIREVLQAIETGTARNVRALADHVRLSSSRLEHLFKVQVGLRLRDALSERRLREALNLLETGNVEIKEIAYARRLPAPLELHTCLQSPVWRASFYLLSKKGRGF